MIIILHNTNTNNIKFILHAIIYIENKNKKSLLPVNGFYHIDYEITFYYIELKRITLPPIFKLTIKGNSTN